MAVLLAFVDLFKVTDRVLKLNCGLVIGHRYKIKDRIDWPNVPVVLSAEEKLRLSARNEIVIIAS